MLSDLPYVAILSALSFFCLVQLFDTLRRHRLAIKDIPLPLAPHSFWWGHLKLLGKIRRELPDDSWPVASWMLLKKRWGLGGVFVLDVYPITRPLLIVIDPKIAASITQTVSLPKAPFVKPYLGRLLGDKSMHSAEGSEWKALRALFNPGFSTSHLMSLIPSMADHIQIFRKKLLDVADTSQVILLQEEATLLSLDIICQTILDVNLGSQLGFSAIAYHFRAAVACTRPHVDLLGRLRMAIPYRWHIRRLDHYLGEAIRQRYVGDAYMGKKSKVAVDLALRAYRENSPGRAEQGIPGKLDKDFFQIALDNIKTLLLGGHDTASSAIAYAHYFLANQPDIRREVRAEHDAIFGLDTEETIRILRDDPARLSRLPLTNAVVKETLRLAPPGLSFRAAPKGTYLEYEGKKIPAWDTDIAVFHYGIHHHEAWADPEVFRPNRFLPPNEVPKDAFRPFELGPRICIGHELAMIEMRAVLLLTLRDFDFEPAYEKDDPSIQDFGGQACKCRLIIEALD